jgi:DNA-binding PadR family transcriptional regulator
MSENVFSVDLDDIEEALGDGGSTRQLKALRMLDTVPGLREKLEERRREREVEPTPAGKAWFEGLTPEEMYEHEQARLRALDKARREEERRQRIAALRAAVEREDHAQTHAILTQMRAWVDNIPENLYRRALDVCVANHSGGGVTKDELYELAEAGRI